MGLWQICLRLFLSWTPLSDRLAFEIKRGRQPPFLCITVLAIAPQAIHHQSQVKGVQTEVWIDIVRRCLAAWPG